MSSGLARDSSTVTPDETKYPIMTPSSSRIVEEWMNRPASMTMSSTTAAPRAAATMINRSGPMPNPEAKVAAPADAEVDSTTRATPRLAPDEIPSTYGSAKGLRKRVCISSPDIPSAAPTSRAVMVRGSRTSWMIVIETGSTLVPPVTTVMTSPNGMFTDPNARPARVTATKIAARIVKRTGNGSPRRPCVCRLRTSR